MDPIHETHVSEPGLLVVDVAAADDATAPGFQQLLADQWATATNDGVEPETPASPVLPARSNSRWGATRTQLPAG
ncbi:DUF6207 family protein [Streptomyces sp. NPDC021056]|uniref:DUF6207 family protein n=1 Tax=Streptomyces sp. NPDC021056 TaxID=3155012 RepID=UPI0033EA871D